MHVNIQLCVQFTGTLMEPHPCVQQVLLRIYYALGSGLTD